MMMLWLRLKNQAMQGMIFALIALLLGSLSPASAWAVEVQSLPGSSGLMNIKALAKNPFQLPAKSLHIPRQVFTKKLPEPTKHVASKKSAAQLKPVTLEKPVLAPPLVENAHAQKPEKLPEKLPSTPKLSEKLPEKASSESTSKLSAIPAPKLLPEEKAAEKPGEKTEAKIIAKPDITPTPIAPEAVEPAASTVPIPLAAGDVIDVQDTVMGVLVKSGNILSDGSISLPLVGRVAMAGMTVAQARQDLTERYKQFYTEPQISLRIAKRHPVRVYLTGAVANPGVYISGKDTRPEALKNQAALGEFNQQFRFYRLYLADALIMAGGLNYNANVRDILIHRRYPTQQVLHVNVLELFQGGNTVQDIALQDQDVVEVSALPENTLVLDAAAQAFERSNLNSDEFKISVIGAVTKPGGYTLHRSDNVLSAIAKAGGFTPVANPGRVYVLHATEKGQLTHREINMQDKKLLGKRPIAEWTALLPNDVVFVDESGARKAAFYGRDLFLDRIAVAAMFPFFSKFFSGR